MVDLVEFIHARLVEAEELALAAPPRPWRPDDEHYAVLASDGEHVADGFALSSNQWRITVDHIVAHDPAAVLRDVAAMRQVMQALDVTGDRDIPVEAWQIAKEVRRHIASRLSTHPSYRQEWTP